MRRQIARGSRIAAALATLAVAAVAHAQPARGTDFAGASTSTNWMDWVGSVQWWPWRDSRPPLPAGVQSPHYGDSLFYFFQGRYFTAVTGLMVSQQFGRMAPHDDEAEILRGGLFLSYGPHREAGEIFATLIERKAPQPVRDRAWYYLAKIRYQRGLYAEAQEALGRIEKPLPGALEEVSGEFTLEILETTISPLSFREPLQRTLEVGEIDIYSFEGQAGESVVISLTGSFDTYLTLTDEAGLSLIENDDSIDSTNNCARAVAVTGATT